MAQPLLHLGDVGVVLQRAGGGGGAQGVRAHVLAGDAQMLHIKHHDLRIHATGRERRGRRAKLGLADAPEQRAVRVPAMAGGGQVLGHQSQRVRVRRQEAQLAALAVDC